MAGVLWLNDLDASTLGFTLTGAPSLLDAAPRTARTLAIPGRYGEWLSASAPIVNARTLRLSGVVYGTSLAEGLGMWDRVKAHVGEGLVDIKHAWAPDRVLRGTLIDAPGGPGQRAWLGHLDASLEFLLADPFAYDLEPQLIGFGATPVALPLGTAPSVGQNWWSAIITITGAATTPTLTYSDAAGNTISTMVFTWSPTINDAIEIDVGRGLVTRIASSVRSNGMADVTAGWEFPRLAPSDGDWYTSAWPRLAVSTGSATIRYYRAWG